jgi:hypothetical protein
MASTAAAWFEPGSSHVGFVVDKVELGQVFSEYFGFPCQSLLQQLFHSPLSIMWGWYDRQIVAAISSELSLIPLIISHFFPYYLVGSQLFVSDITTKHNTTTILLLILILYIARMEKRRHAYKVIVGKPEGNRDIDYAGG